MSDSDFPRFHLDRWVTGEPRVLSLADFLLARIAEDEAWAQAAVWTPGATHWHWVDAETDTPVLADPFTQAAITDEGAVSLRTVEELKAVAWEGGQPLPDFVIWQVDDMLSPGAAGHIARHDPARVLAECEAKRRIVKAFEEERVRRDIYNRDYDSGEYDFNDNDLRARLASNARCRGLEKAMLALATVYAGHPDYREEWRP